VSERSGRSQTLQLWSQRSFRRGERRGWGRSWWIGESDEAERFWSGVEYDDIIIFKPI
jgi:hypothetical protein